MPAERSVSTSVFAQEEKGKPLRGTHRRVAAATGGHGSSVVPPASKPAPEPAADPSDKKK